MLNIIWFILWGVLWAVYFMLDGFDLGAGTLMPFLAKNDKEKRVIYNAMGPLWDGNEVWLITAGGATFAAFPTTYAVMFNGLYSALLLLLFALIVRGVSFEFRGKVESEGWKKIWDFCLFIGSFLPALLLGVAFANIFRGLPIDENGIFHGGLFTLLNPYGLLGGILFVLMFLVHGAIWIAIKSEGDLRNRALSVANKIWYLELIFAVIFLVVSAFATDLWENYGKYPLLWIIPLLAVAGLILIKIFLLKEKDWKAWFSSSLFIVMATFWGVAGLFPRMIPSTINPEYSLTIYNSSSSPLTLKVMFVVALIFVPIVIGYQIWVYNLFKGKVTDKELSYEEAY